MSHTLLVDAITRRFEGRQGAVDALAGFSLVLGEGETCVLVGPSGCGKSTALAIIAGLDEPSSGRVWVCGREVAGPGAERGVVFQRDALFPWLSVRENALFGLGLAEVRRRHPDAGALRAGVDDLLRRVGLWEFRHHHPHQLSGGMRQRAALVRALATRPPVLLMDEPFAALDAQTREDMQALVDGLCHEHRTTLVLVTHDLEEAAVMADRVLVMRPRPGRVCAELAMPAPRPRPPDFRLSHQVQDLRGRLHRLLHDPGDAS